MQTWAAAHDLAGVIAAQADCVPVAIECVRNAVAAVPADHTFLGNLSLAFGTAGQTGGLPAACRG